ncbi:co-chaperone GroES [Candidatus Margulisiibacteriota bacterium]
MKMKYRPLEDRVILEPQEAAQVTKTGIVLPDTAQEKPQMGKVIKAGPGKVSDKGELIKTTLKEGDIVIYPKYGGTEIKIDTKDFLIVRESDILAVQTK